MISSVIKKTKNSMKFYDDVFISVCLTIDDLPQENIASSIKEVTTSLGKNFKFWELIFVHEANQKLSWKVKNF